ncbi:MAG: hypothetical protein QOF48_1998 [Verrucomicrobiota bacterium]|jgi:prepilin-type N-terminal cleavage/methylation domain-containing protein
MMRVTLQHLTMSEATFRANDMPVGRACAESYSIRGRRAGFSLIEIMVAVSLLAVIIVGLLAMFYQVQRAFRAGTTQSDVMEGGRATMGLISREMQEISATYLDGVTNLFVVLAGGSAPYRQSLLNGERRDNILQDFAFVRRVNDEWIGTAYRFSNAVTGVGTLYRYVTNSLTSNPADLSTNVCTNGIVSGFPGIPNTNFHPVLDGVVHFSVEVFDTNGNRYPYFPRDPAPYVVSGNTTIGYRFVSNALPAFIDLELAVLEPVTLEKFKYRSETGTPNDLMRAQRYLDDKTSRMHVFRQRIPIRAAGADFGGGP